MIIGKFEMGLRTPRSIPRTQAQVFVEPIRLNQLAGIHLPIGIPERLELSERLHELSAKHLGKKLGARLPVSMLARERSAIAND